MRRSVAWLCLVTTLAFAGLDAVHQHRHGDGSSGALAHPCRICQLAGSIHPGAGHAPLILERRDLGERVIPPPSPAAASSPLALPRIRPPPAFVSCP
ncbi:MAG TPA: hypothetical protein VNF74_02235 [Terriglobales bacterium]|nr:hypothetical protein [Terriglobales bacterium]